MRKLKLDVVQMCKDSELLPPLMQERMKLLLIHLALNQ